MQLKNRKKFVLNVSEWMRNWEEECKGAGANLVADFVICNDAPDDVAAAACKSLGDALAK